MLNLVSQAFTAHPVYSIRFQRVNCSVVHVERPPASKGCRTPPTTWTPIENKNIPQAKSRTNARIPVRRIDTRHEGHDTRHSSLISALKVTAFHCIGRVMFFFFFCIFLHLHKSSQVHDLWQKDMPASHNDKQHKWCHWSNNAQSTKADIPNGWITFHHSSRAENFRFEKWLAIRDDETRASSVYGKRSANVCA